LKEQLAERDTKIVELEARLNQNSSNSSKPPSKDAPNFDRNQARRRKSNRKPGGQKGHKGSTLKMVSDPDAVVEHAPAQKVCDCGAVVNQDALQVLSRHQVFDIPCPPPPVVTEHRVLGCICSECGHSLKGVLPSEVSSAPTSYGSRIAAYVAYLSARHYLPIKRLTELVGDMFAVSVSTGTIANMLTRCARSLSPVVKQIKQAIAGSNVVAADETYVRESGRKINLWIWCTPHLLYLVRGPNRAYEVIKREWPQGFPESIITSDRWAAQLKTPSKAKQLCAHHLLRECNGIIQRSDSTGWIEMLREVIQRIVKAGALGRRCNGSRTRELEQDLEELLDEKYLSTPLCDKEATLLLELRKWQESMTTCLHHHDVPPDNDTAERGIRGAKVKMNVSNQWRSQKGTEQYCVIRSVIGSAIRQGLRPLDVLMNPQILAT